MKEDKAVIQAINFVRVYYFEFTIAYVLANSLFF